MLIFCSSLAKTVSMQLNKKRWKDEYSVLWCQSDVNQVFLDATPVLAVLGVVCKLVTIDELRECSREEDLLVLSGLCSESACFFPREKFRRVCFAPMFTRATELVEYLVNAIDELDATQQGVIRVDIASNMVISQGASVELSTVEAEMFCRFLSDPDGGCNIAEFRSMYPEIFRDDVKVRVYLSMLRRKLRPINLEITAFPQGHYKLRDPQRRLKFIGGREV